MARRFHAAGKVAGAGFQHGRGGGDDVGHVGADLRLALVDDGGQRVLAVVEGVGDVAGAVDQRFVDLAGAGLQRGVELLRAGVERLGAGLELTDQCLTAFGQGAFDAGKACLEFRAQRARGTAEQRNHALGAVVEQFGQRAGEAVGAVGQLGDAGVEQAGEGFAGRGETVGDRIQTALDGIEDRHRAFVDAVDQLVARRGDRHRQLGRGAKDVLANDIACRIDFVAQRLMGAGDRGAHALGVADDGLALAAEAVDERTDTALIVGVGAFELADLAVDERFELDGTRQRALDAFAHRGNLAAHRLADHHHAVLRDILRLGEAEGNFGHRLGGDAHVLRAADHRREGPEQDDRHDGGDRNTHQLGALQDLRDRADVPDIGAEQQIGERCGTRDPGDRNESHHPIDGVGGTAVQAVQQGAIIFLAIVIGGRKTSGLAVAARLDGAKLGRLRFGRGGPGCRIGGCGRGSPFRAPGACQLVGGLRNLGFQILHRGGDIEISRPSGKVEIESLFELLGNLGIEILRGGGFLRHAYATLY